ncbi:MAG: anaerobic ribonucleotide reductase-activating protein [Pelotomaculum sp. PtaU1.Bin035]|nr:MAG: anaerobic ribonucleotide reductase-activating protein [Pelotomaculum sp. PtaU1.Bin035]
MRLYIGRICYPVTNLGPGKRFVLWVQGCSRRCPGCMSPELLVPDRGLQYSVREVFTEIQKIALVCGGVTISGGEPFEQAGPLAELCSLIKNFTNLDIMIYSGYTINEIMAGTYDMNLLLSKTDIIVDGSYRRELSGRKLWRGSDNQNLYLLTPHAQKYRQYVNAEYSANRQLLFQMTSDGQIVIIGIPARDFFMKFNSSVEKRGIKLKRAEWV